MRLWQDSNTIGITLKQNTLTVAFHKYVSSDISFTSNMIWWPLSLEKVWSLSKEREMKLPCIYEATHSSALLIVIRTLSKRGRQRQHREAIKIFFRNSHASIQLVWIHCLCLFSLKFSCLQHLSLNEKIDIRSHKVHDVLKTPWRWSSWSLIQEHDGTDSFLIFTCAF